MIRLRDLPAHFELNPGQFDHVATSDAVAALATTIKQLPEGFSAKVVNTYYNDQPLDGVDITRVTFSKGDKFITVNIPAFMEHHNDYYHFRRDFMRALEQLK